MYCVSICDILKNKRDLLGTFFLQNEKIFLKNRDKKKAELYLKEKHVMSLVNHLTSTLLLHKPDDPATFLVRQVEDMIGFRDRQGKPPILFSDDHLTNIFKSIDFLKTGSFNMKQYISGKLTLHWKYVR